MADLSRRGFLTRASVATGVGLAGGLGLHKLVLGGDAPHMPAPAASSSAAPLAEPSRVDTLRLAGPMLVHIRDVASAEVAMMVGAQELVYRDPELVSRLLKTAASAGQAEG